MTDPSSPVPPLSIDLSQLGLILTHIDDAVVGLDDHATVRFASPGLRNLTGFSPEAVLGRNVVEFVHPDDVDDALERLARWAGRRGATAGPTVRARRAAGGWVDVSVEAVTGEPASPFTTVLTMRAAGGEAEALQDLHRRLVNEDRLTRLASAFVGLPSVRLGEGIDAALEEMGGLEGVDRVCLVLLAEGGTLVHNTHEWVAPGIDSWRERHEWFPRQDLEVFDRLERLETVSIPSVEALDDRWAPEKEFWRIRSVRSVATVPLVADGAMVGFLAFEAVREERDWDAHHLSTLRSGAGIIAQALDRWAAELELSHQARHDPVTGLGNRWAFVEMLGRAVQDIDPTATPRSGVAVVLFDVDRFKVVNDSLGHAAGDAVLAELARRFEPACPPGSVARLGGDELVVLLDGVTDVHEATVVAERLRAMLREPLTVMGHESFISVSAGIAFTDDPAASPDDLLRDADVAMYEAKALGRSRVVVFDDDLATRVRARLRSEHELRLALQRGQLEVHYQPEVALETGEIVAVEALCRWRHPDRGLVPASEFIEIAEESALILDLGAWVMREACAQVGRWHREKPDRPLTLRVNLSARQLGQPDLVATVVDALEAGGLVASSLCLEITETTVMADPEVSLQVLEKLRGLGLELAIDDFGTGYSSLGYLKRLPVDVVKIDRTFVSGLGTDTDDTAIVGAIVGLARSLVLGVTAEGVETVEQLDELVRLGCRRGQGFLFAPALAPDELAELAGSPILPTRSPGT